jgi:NADH-quinone oxidoreductase subunit H
MEAYGISSLAKLIRALLEQYLPDKFFVDLAMTVVGIVGIFAVMLTMVALLVWVERKVSAFMQMRLGFPIVSGRSAFSRRLPTCSNY